MRLSFDFTNKLLDNLFRGQSLTLSSQLWVGLFNVAPTTSASGGTEVSALDYKRQPVERTLFGFCGTQGSGSTDPSSGTSGTISNNDTINWPVPTEDWGTIVGFALFNQEEGTEEPYILYCDLVTPVLIEKNGPAVSFPVGGLQVCLATRS